MSQIEIDRRQNIIEAALRVFAREGYHKASIKQIAQEAGLKAPSLIYWYFKDKQELMQAVVLETSPLVRQVQQPEELLDEPPEKVLPLVMNLYYQTLDSPNGREFIRLLILEAIRTPQLAEQYSSGQLRVVQFMITYLNRQIELGRFRQHNSEALARSFLGALFGYVLSHELMPHLKGNMPDRASYVEETVKVFLEGLSLD
jgi:AcrR family transcriptional regulator